MSEALDKIVVKCPWCGSELICPEATDEGVLAIWACHSRYNVNIGIDSREQSDRCKLQLCEKENEALREKRDNLRERLEVQTRNAVKHIERCEAAEKERDKFQRDYARIRRHPAFDHQTIVAMRAEIATLRGEISRLAEIGRENLERIDRWREAYINLRKKSRGQQADVDRLRIKLADAWLKIGALVEVDDA